jgi:hypothetical protein
VSDPDPATEDARTAGSDPVTTARLLRKRLASSPIELPVSGQSMGSTIRSGSTVRLVELSEPRRGEIWAFVGSEAPDGEGQGTDERSSRSGTGIVVHRIRHIGRDSITGRGDGNRLDDRTVPRSHLIGRVVSAIGPDGTARHFGTVDRHIAATRLWVRSLARGAIDTVTRRPRRPGPTS